MNCADAHERRIASACRHAALVEPSPGADLGGMSPVSVQMWAGVSPVLVQMWATLGRVAVQMWATLGEPSRGADVGGLLMPVKTPT